VNLASRLEGQSVPGRILICPQCHEKLGDAFTYEARGPVEIKGIGAQETWFLIAERHPEEDQLDAPLTPSALPRSRNAS
jgi:adenylate cyclase